MRKLYAITAEDTPLIREKMKTTKKANIYRRLEAVALRREGKSNKEIAEITKYNAKRVSQLVSIYVNESIEVIASDGRKGGNHKNLSDEKEREILESFKDSANEGKLITPAEIKQKYDEALGRETKASFIYAVLKRQGWRMVMPRSKHPKKASDEAIEASKKLTIRTRN